ncbi:MAG: stage II sporulation protein M [Chloroflexi bacterium]|nr:stage II sporulation protein M [Chloroflexota bacterium]
MATVDELIAARRARWEQLAVLLKRAGSDPRRLSAAEIESLSQLYRQVVSDLAVARRDFPQDQVVGYLNGLAQRAYPLVYRAPVGSWQRLAQFFLVEFPERYRACSRFVLAAFLLFTIPAIVAFAVVQVNPTLAEEILPADMTRGVRNGHLWTNMPPAERPYMASFIMTNNIQVSLIAFAGGMLLGTLTVYAMVQNGLMLGSVLGYTHLYGLSADLLGFVSPHGYIELTVIFIAGGGGLRMTWGIIQPGLLRRRDALVQGAQEAVLLVVGAMPLLVVAGLIEGFISPSSLPNVVKYVFGLLTGIVLHLWLLGPSVWVRLGPRRRAAAGRAMMHPGQRGVPLSA